MRLFFLLIAAVIASASGRSAAAQGSATGTISAARTKDEINFDGRLDETAWSEAATVELIQQSPKPGSPTPFQTQVRVLLKDDTLYFGFICTDPEPDKIAVHTRQRDGDLDGDDRVAIVLDTYGDKRTGYFFEVNAAGARLDGLISDPEHPSSEWDGIWDARTVRTGSGWTAEVLIPSRTLNFKPGLESWGLNVERFVARAQLALRWTSPTLDSFLYDLSRAGLLSGIEDLKQGLAIEASPHVVGRTQQRFGKTPRVLQGTGGVDFTWRVTPQMAAIVTVNTDFAETEVDARQINLTRFPLFFPEKRGFFLEGANQFAFGLGVDDEFIPFFTRRIGLLEGQQVPINAGVKLNGRAGRWNLAMLDVQTRESGLARATNLFAGRASYDVNTKFRLGTVITNGDPSGLKDNRLAGFDAVWRTSTFRGDKNFLIGVWSAFAGGDLPAGRRSGWGFKVDYPNDLVDCATTYTNFGHALLPALGFLPRPGTRRVEVGCEYSPRPSKQGPFRWVRQQAFESRYFHVRNLNGVTESWRLMNTPINVQFESGDQIEIDHARQYELLPEPFEVGGVVIPLGDYRFTRWRIKADSSKHRPIQVGASSWFGNFYRGRLTQWESYANWTSPNGQWHAGITAENNFGRLPWGNFVQRLWQLQTAFAWNPNLILSSFIQYDSESQNLGTNTRLRWTLQPGNDVFIVWNRHWQRLITSRHDLSLLPDSEFLAIKLRWTFR